MWNAQNQSQKCGAESPALIAYPVVLRHLRSTQYMNTLLSLWTGVLSALIPQTFHAQNNLALDQAPTYTCSDLQWTTPAAIGSDGHLLGTADIECDFQALSGGGFPELQAYLISEMQKEAIQVNSGPVPGTMDSLPSQTYDFNMNLTFSGSQVNAHELGTIATDNQTRLESLMKTESITGSSYDNYIKGFDFNLDVTPNTATSGTYHVSLNVAIDITKPLLVPAGLFQSKVVSAVEGAVTNYRDTMMTELQNNI